MDIIQCLDAEARKRVEGAAKVLADYGLAVAVPHLHSSSGEIGDLPTDVASYEEELRVTFIPKSAVPSHAIPVGWRWLDDQLQVYALCCADQPPDSPPRPSPGPKPGL